MPGFTRRRILRARHAEAVVSVELRPLGVSCNIGCRYCYQNPSAKRATFARSTTWRR